MHFPWHLYLMGIIYFLAGINHFIKPGMYIKIIPPLFGNPELLNSLAGIAEIVLGITLIVPSLSRWAAWGIILLLIAVFPANIYMYCHKEAAFGLPRWLLLTRLGLQFLLIYWAYLYTKP